jgi:proline dehydrogenase
MTREQLQMRAISKAITELRLNKQCNLDQRTDVMLVRLDDHLFELMMGDTVQQMVEDLDQS